MFEEIRWCPGCRTPALDPCSALDAMKHFPIPRIILGTMVSVSFANQPDRWNSGGVPSLIRTILAEAGRPVLCQKVCTVLGTIGRRPEKHGGAFFAETDRGLMINGFRCTILPRSQKNDSFTCRPAPFARLGILHHRSSLVGPKTGCPSDFGEANCLELGGSENANLPFRGGKRTKFLSFNEPRTHFTPSTPRVPLPTKRANRRFTRRAVASRGGEGHGHRLFRDQPSVAHASISPGWHYRFLQRFRSRDPGGRARSSDRPFRRCHPWQHSVCSRRWRLS